MRIRDKSLADLFGLNTRRWSYLKTVLLREKVQGKREQKRQLLLAEAKHVAHRRTLYDHVGLSLRQRAAFLNFGRVSGNLFTKNNLRLLYIREGVKFKNVRMRNAPSLTSKSFMNRPTDLMRLKSETKELLSRGYDIIVIDEACYTWRGYKR